MTIYPIEAGNFKLDGGAMFGVVPKSLWQRTNPSDSDNLIEMSSRCLLIENGNRLTLIDTGMGDKQSEKFFSYYKRWGDYTLVGSLKSAGFSVDDITDVLLTHLHFDHCGGASFINSRSGKAEVLFKNAKYWSNQKHWDWATAPNPREKASFLWENLNPIKESGQLNFIAEKKDGFSFYKELGFEIMFVDGHTEKQMIPKISYKNQELVYAADLIPTVGHIPIPYLMSYDVRPLLTMKEKKLFLEAAVKNNWLLFLEHDPHNEIVSLKNTEKGVGLNTSNPFKEL
jgi:glyoxylase-like metal-dependent hydrolase (beta-lactamase superfamily II)